MCDETTLKAISQLFGIDVVTLRLILSDKPEGLQITGFHHDYGSFQIIKVEDLTRHVESLIAYESIPSYDETKDTGPVVLSVNTEPVVDMFTYYLYRLFDSNDRLLYVGITRNLKGRISAHKRNWGDIIARIEYVEYGNHAACLAAETNEIAEKCPPFNSKDVGSIPITRKLAAVQDLFEEQ